MGDIIEIYGSKITLPELPSESEILYFGLDRPLQKWSKQELPYFFENVEINKDGDLFLTSEQEGYAALEVKRCKKGVWALIGGKNRYITGKYYFYLQYYTLEDGNSPDFREADRLYFLFHDYWQKIEWCLGNIRTKKRRQGASSQSCSNILYEAIFYKNSNCGLISKTKEDSKETFTQMITFAYRQLPIFLKPKQVNKEDSVTELVFAHKATSAIKDGIAATIKNEKGHNSRVNYKAPVLNSYDRGRLSYGLLDEFGKLPKEVPASQLLSIISKTLVKGVKKVGWVDMPSTTNDMEKGGGMEYYKIWKGADQFKRRPTINRLVRFYQPAYEAYEGFIDEFGDSVINEPTQEQYKYLVEKWVKRDEDGELISELSEDDIKLGAKYYIQVKRRQGLEGILLEEEIRQNPCTEDEAFMSTVSDCTFNSLNINNRKKFLEENTPIYRNIIYYRKENLTVGWRDATPNENFFWKTTYILDPLNANKFKYDGNAKMPNNKKMGCITVDSYSNTQGGRKYGSKASAFLGLKFDLLDPHNTGKAVQFLYGRPPEKDMLHSQVMLCAEYNGVEVFYEHTSDDYYSYFRDRGKINYLGRYPYRLIDPIKKETTDRHRGTPITPFSLTRQLDDAISYFEHHCDQIDFIEILDNALIFNPYDRTSYDTMVSFLILISTLQEPLLESTKRKEPLITVYPRQPIIPN